jgi:hypothetical protein
MSRTKEAKEIIDIFEETVSKPEYAFRQDAVKDSMKLSVMMDIMMSLAVIADKLTEEGDDGQKAST